MRPPLVVIPQHFGCLVFDRRTSRYLPFDRECAALLLRLRSEPVGKIAAAGGPRVLDFYESLYGLGFFRWDGTLAADVLPLDPPAGRLAGPLAVHLEVSAECNLACAHCFAGDLPRRETPLGPGELDRLFGTLARIGSFRLGLTGGEPLLRKDLLEIVDLAAARGLHPCLATNGLLITEDLARELGRRDLLWLNVSLDGASPETNDRIRGRGTFRRVMEKLAILRRHARFTLAFTVLEGGGREVEACARLARETGAQAAVFRPLYPVGRAARRPGLMPRYDEYAGVLARLARSPGRPAPDDGCGAGKRVCSISIGGDVSPCSFLGPAHVAGNLRETPFEEIWHSSAVFREFRGLGGGCRARALALNGSVRAPDPWYEEFVERGAGVHPLSTLEA